MITITIKLRNDSSEESYKDMSLYRCRVRIDRVRQKSGLLKFFAVFSATILNFTVLLNKTFYI